MNRNTLNNKTGLRKGLTILLLLSASSIFAQPGLVDSAKIPKPTFHYQPEYNFDLPKDATTWQNVSAGLNVSFASTNRVHYRAEVPNLNMSSRDWKATGWIGERLNAMILIWSSDTINQVRFITGDLKNEKGNLIKKSSLNLQLVRYVISNYPYDAREVTCGVGPDDKAYLMPDRLESFDRFDLPGKTTRPVWLSLDIPQSTVPGTYKGIIEVRTEKTNMFLNVEIKVQKQILPAPRDWGFRLDLWQNPWVLAEYYKVPAWGTEHMSLLKKHMQLYADAGGKYITTYAVHSPWADNSYMIEGSMIEWIKDRQGRWKFDYEIFDKYIQLAMDCGVDKAITIYTPIPWGERFRYKDEETGKYVTEQWLPTSAIFRQNWNVFLTDLKSHLEKKGWFDKTYLGINENAMEQTLAAIRVLKQHSPKWRITYAGDWHPELNDLLDDYSCVYGKEPSMTDVLNRTNRQKSTTYYICCTPAKPNTFVFSPPVEGRWLGWYAQAYGYDGLLRWAYDAWPADPVRDARHGLWPAGDCFMVYPGASSSIRYEKMREGIVDFEKLKWIYSKSSRSMNPTIKRLVTELKQHMKVFTLEKEFKSPKLELDIEQGNKLIEQLSDLLPAK